jgi:MFS transporter, DHA3 family, tetracycline resistance protein
MTRNTTIFLLTEAILAAAGGFILPIYVLYFRQYQITIFEVALLAAIFEASILFFEIPTGLLADRFGRKMSVVTGFLLFGLSGLIFILQRNLGGFIAGEIVLGLGEAFISGAGEALAVDSLPEGQSAVLLPKLFVWRSRVRIIMSTIFMLAAGFLYTINISIAFYPILIGGVLGTIGAAFFEGQHATQPSPVASFFKPLKSLFRQISLSGALKVIFLASLVANFSFEGVDQYWQVLCSEFFNINIRTFGFITAAGAIIAFFLVGPLVRRTAGGLSTVLLILLVAGAIISSLPHVPRLILPLFLVLHFICKELIAPLFSISINSIIPDAGRATFLSGYNLTCSIGEVGAGLLIGVMASELGIPAVFVLSGSLLVIFIVIAMFTFRTALEPSRRN